MDDQQRARELKPCPFCGGQPRPGFASTGVPGLEDCGYCYIECCDVHIHRDDEDACAEAWNRRAALRAAPECPEGFVIVPEIATEAMLSAAYPRNKRIDDDFDRQGAWADCLAARQQGVK